MVLKVSAFALASVLITAAIEKQNKEISLIIKIFSSFSVALFVFKNSFSAFSELFEKFNAVSSQSRIISVILKGGAICVISGLVSDICKESGNTALSGTVDFASRAIIFTLSVPLIEMIIETALSFIK
ncbi:MAG: stage III sporulation AC/AD family protein [Clostridia bacterium]|nr:stage III sporulation AC/AD family protein [Clostridia bacterium]